MFEIRYKTFQLNFTSITKGKRYKLNIKVRSTSKQFNLTNEIRS